MIGLDWSAIGLGLAGLVSGVGIWWTNRKKNAAVVQAAVADARADVALSESQAAVYSMLGERLSTLEEEVRNLRGELATERLHSRKLELHIYRLEAEMRRAGLSPPEFDVSKA